MIELKALSMGYPLDKDTVTVLCGIDLTIGQGESVAVVGPSGSGKTTLLLLLAGLERPSCGAIFMDGVQLSATTCALLGSTSISGCQNSVAR